MHNFKSYKIESIKYNNGGEGGLGNIFKTINVGNNITIEEDLKEEEDENINLGTTKINFWFTNDGITKIYIWLRKLLIDYEIFY
jgi:hypothetical protein